MTYGYLKKYNSSLYGGRIPWPNNIFHRIEDAEILEAEKLLGYRFPNQLRQFYQEIGEGRLVCPHNRSEEYEFGASNEILPPMVVARFTKGIYEWEGQDHWISMETVEDLQEGDMPFFEIGDSTRFLLMKPFSDNPNAIWHQSYYPEFKVENSFEKFIWRLYYEDPGFYDDILDKYYKNL